MTTIDSHGEVSEDYLDRLPDELLLAIFARVRDVATLVRLLSLCRRFHSLVPLTDSVSLSFNSPQLPLVPNPSGKGRPSSFAKNPLGFLYDRIFRSLIRRLVSSKSRSGGCRSCLDEEDIVGDVGERLKLFGEAKDVRVILPCEGSTAEKDSSFLKWTASYGSQIRSCVILGAGEVRRIREPLLMKPATNREEEPPVALSDGDLKLRVVWIISCLIAASYRHYMVKKVIKSSPMLRRVVVGDERGQGKVVMGEDEVREVRKEDNDLKEDETERSEVPDLRMKMWHAPYLELPRCGCVLKGATLVVMTPVKDDGNGSEDEILKGGIEEGDADDDDDDDDGVFVEAVRELRKRNKLYLMEMNSF